MRWSGRADWTRGLEGLSNLSRLPSKLALQLGDLGLQSRRVVGMLSPCVRPFGHERSRPLREWGELGQFSSGLGQFSIGSVRSV